MNFPHRLQNHALVSPASCQQAVLGAMSCACRVACTRSCHQKSVQGVSVRGAQAQLPPPFLPGTPPCSHPGGTGTAVPSTRNQGLCDIGVGAEGSVGNAGTTPRSAAALVVTSPGHEQLPLATGSDEGAAPPPVAGHVLACARHIRKLWDLRAPAHGRSLRHDARRGWHECPARGLALDRQHPESLVFRRWACMWRVPHQPTVGPHSSTLLR